LNYNKQLIGYEIGEIVCGLIEASGRGIIKEIL
jgi:hypothetical protein